MRQEFYRKAVEALLFSGLKGKLSYIITDHGGTSSYISN